MWWGSFVVCLLIIQAVLGQRCTGDCEKDGDCAGDKKCVNSKCCPPPTNTDATGLVDGCPRYGRYDDGNTCPDNCTPTNGGTMTCGENKLCCRNVNCGGSVCVPDMNQCSDSASFLRAAMSCLQDFMAALTQTNFTEYCGYFKNGSSCIAKELVDQMYQRECLERMVEYLKTSSDEIFDLLQEYGISHNEAITNRSAECFVDNERPDTEERQITRADLKDECPIPGWHSYNSTYCPSSCSSSNNCGDTTEKCCTIEECGPSCVPDMTRCSKVTMISEAYNIPHLTACFDEFRMALKQTFFHSYCVYFRQFTYCLADELAGDIEHVEECLARMLVVMRISPNDVFDFFEDMEESETYNKAFVSRSTECFGTPGSCSNNPCKNEGICIEEASRNHYQCLCNRTPYGGETCSKVLGVELKTNHKIKINWNDIDTAVSATQDFYISVSFTTKKKQGILAQLTNADYTQSLTLKINNNGGVSFVYDNGESDWQIHSSVDDDLSDGKSHMARIRKSPDGTVTLQVDRKPEIVHSTDFMWPSDLTYTFIGKNDTTMNGNGFEGCVYNMEINNGFFPFKFVFMDPRPAYIESVPDKLEESTCGSNQVDEIWNKPCPDMNDEETEMCPKQCSADQPCRNTGENCCYVNSGDCQLCIPDMTQCVDISVIKMKLGSCLVNQNIFESKNQKDFCSSFWGTLECISKEIASDTYHMMCLKRMAMFLRGSPLNILRALGEQANVQISDKLMRFARNALNCEESPVYRAPVRPIPDEVKSCSDVSVIKTKGRGCIQSPVSSQSPSNQQACTKLTQFIRCVASKIYPDEESDTIKQKQCANEIKQMIRKSVQQLKQTFPFLANIDVNTCEEKENVCGGEERPLDDVDCSVMKCRANYTCIHGHCCPTKKMGQCPRPIGTPLCTEMKCSHDHDCEGSKKCCDVGCGSKTCVEMITKEPSKCQLQMMAARRELEMSGICGNGQTVLKVPRCVGASFNPIQGNVQTGMYYCVNEDGTKISGSDFTGNRDCTAVRPGVCPPKPSDCGYTLEPSCSEDNDCDEPGHKCCYTKESTVCQRKCMAANKAPEEVIDDCPNRQCCQITLCQGRVCPKDKTAVCRINSCGTCDVKFYTGHNETIDDCEEGLTQCQKERAQAQQRNNQRGRETGEDKLRSFLESHEGRQSNRRGDEAMDDDDDDDTRMDEYGEKRRKAIGNEMDQDDEEEDAAYVMEAIGRLCQLIERVGFCKNESICTFGFGESDFEVCHCKDGMMGVQCDQKIPTGFVDTQCNRDSERLEDMKRIMSDQTRDRDQIIFHDIFNKFSKHISYRPYIDCLTDGDFNQTQRARFLPDLKENSHDIYICVNTTNGKRIMHSPVTMVSTNTLPDCDTDKINYQHPDILSVPKKCMVSSPGCNEMSCDMFYWNQGAGKCEKGDIGYGFHTATDCYDNCDLKAVCSEESMTDTGCEECDRRCELVFENVAGPEPCMYKECDYHRQYCNVTVEIDGTMTGECQDFPEYCLQEPNPTDDRDSGFIAYYFDATTRRCKPFIYPGEGGNMNRFYDLRQCQAECSTQPYKYDVISCPIPDVLMRQRGAPGCDNDFDCKDDQVCCASRKNQKVCTTPFGVCSSGERCSLYGACEDGSCVCPECLNVEEAQVCGSDNKTYNSLCHLQEHACRTHQPLSKLHDGVCKSVECGDGPQVCIAVYQPVCGKGMKTGVLQTFGNECEMNVASCGGIETYVKHDNGNCAPEGGQQCLFSCSKEFIPLCAYYQDPSTNRIVTNTYNNKCLLMKAMVCEVLHLQVLYHGECNKNCGRDGSTCELYEDCIDGQCKCPNVCTKEYTPTCAHPMGNDGELETFDNPCMLRMESCKTKTIYVIKKDGACKDPEPELECPKFPANITGSAEFLCNAKTNKFCDRKTQTCCPYGAGTKCINNKDMRRKAVKKPGLCSRLSSYNTQKSQCESDKCKDDSDCSGTAKCCFNSVCRFSTCAVPDMPMDKIQCGPQQTLLDDIRCSAEEECPMGGTCKVVTSEDGVTDGFCCMPIARELPEESEMTELAICKALDYVGITCGDYGTCSANLTSFQLCQCKKESGNFGFFCQQPQIKPDDDQCPEKVSCVISPCEVNKCEAYPNAKCTDNYCGGCNAVYTYNNVDVTSKCKETLCLRQHALYKRIYETLQTYTEWRRANGDDSMDSMDDEMTTDDEEMTTDEFLKDLMQVMAKIPNFHGLPVDGELKCTENGEFAPVQCVHKAGRQVCYCVNTATGAPIPHTARRDSPEGLSCEIYTDGKMSENCFDDVPGMDSDCDQAVSLRYFFNNETNECEGYNDTGCSQSKNSFNDYRTCRSYCPAQPNTASPCAAVRCGNNQHCRVMGGRVMCVGPQDSGQFEPMCQKDGSYSPKQCNGDVCKCVDPKTGKDVDDSVTKDDELQCVIEGGKVKAEKQREGACEDGSEPQFCDNGAESCQKCEARGNEENNGGNRQGQAGDNRQGQGAGNNQDRPGQNRERPAEDGTCPSCDTCPASSRKKVCDVACKQTTCKSFPTAICVINKCTCKEEFKAGGEVIDCNKVVPNCKRAKHIMEMEQRQKRNNQETTEVTVITCTEKGAYESICKGDKCRCLNATSGEPVGSKPVSKDKLDCDPVQWKTLAQKVKTKLKVSSRPLASFSKNKKDKIIQRLKELFNRFDLMVTAVVLKDGSVIAEIDTECANSNDNCDVSSSVSAVVADVNNGNTSIEVDGESFTLSGATVTGVITSEELYGPITEPTPKEEDDNKTTIIIVVVVVIVVAILVIAVAIYCYTKANRKNKSTDLQFSDLRGQENPTYKS